MNVGAIPNNSGSQGVWESVEAAYRKLVDTQDRSAQPVVSDDLYLFERSQRWLCARAL